MNISIFKWELYQKPKLNQYMKIGVSILKVGNVASPALTSKLFDFFFFFFNIIVGFPTTYKSNKIHVYYLFI
jgi:hypothetical protein